MSENHIELEHLKHALESRRQLRQAAMNFEHLALHQIYSKATPESAHHRERATYDSNFHIMLASASGNDYLVKTLRVIFDRLILKRRVDGYRSTRAKQAVTEHIELLKALKKGDGSKAERILRQHIQVGKTNFLEHLRQISAA